MLYSEFLNAYNYKDAELSMDDTPQLGGDLDVNGHDIAGFVKDSEITSFISELKDDTSPQLGGDLDLNGHSITGTVTLPSDTVINLINDTSPQLGGNLDLNGHSIAGVVASDTSPQLGGDLDVNGHSLNTTNFTGDVSYENTVISSSSTIVINCSLGNSFSVIVNQSTTQSFSNNPASGDAYVVLLKLGNAGDHAITWDSSIKWTDDTVPEFTTNTDTVVLYTIDGGNIWYGSVQLGYV